MAQKRGAGRPADYTNPQAVSGKNYLLAIGIDAYTHWQPLSNAVKDAQEFVRVLTQQYQFEAEEVFTLFNQEATEGNIYQAIREMKRRLEPRDNLVVYYSGHGHYDEDFDEGYWIPVDAQPNDESDYISNANIVKRLNALDTQHTLLIVDSCFSGSLVVRKRNALPDEKFKSRRILASGRHETVSDGKKGENSPFAAGLLTVLRKNTTPKVDTTSVIRYVKDYVYGKARQHPVDGRIQNSADEGGEFVFHLRKDEETVWREVCIAHTVDAYRDYLSGFPDGRYATPAKRKIANLEEDEVWETARLNDNEEAYKDYIRAYTPNGKHLARAQKRLAELQADLAKRKQIYDELAEKEQGREEMRKTYQALVAAAEQHFQARELDAARDKYREAIQAYVPGFVPEQRYLEEQYNLCRTSLDFLRLYEQGKTFMEAGNYRLAIEYFQQALKIKHVGKVEALVAECERQLTAGPSKRTAYSGATSSKRTTTRSTTQKPKKRIGLWIALGAVLTFGILGAIGMLMDESSTDYVDEPAPIINNTQQFKSDLPEDTYTPPPARTIQQQILGSWEVYAVDMLINGVTYDLFETMPALSYLRGTTYDFSGSGTVAENSALGYQVYNYSTTEKGAIYIAIPGYYEGTIDELNANYLTITLPYSEDGGYTVANLTFSMERSAGGGR